MRRHWHVYLDVRKATLVKDVSSCAKITAPVVQPMGKLKAEIFVWLIKQE